MLLNSIRNAWPISAERKNRTHTQPHVHEYAHMRTRTCMCVHVHVHTQYHATKRTSENKLAYNNNATVTFPITPLQ